MRRQLDRERRGIDDETFAAELGEAKLIEYFTAFDRLIEVVATHTDYTPTADYFYFRAFIRQYLPASHPSSGLAAIIADHSRVIDLNPTDASAHNNRGLTRQSSGDLDGAIADFTRAIELDSTFAAAHNNRGFALYGKKEFDRAIRDYDRAIALDPKNWQAWANRAVATRQTDRPATIHALQQAYRYCDEPAMKQQLADRLRQLGATVPE